MTETNTDGSVDSPLSLDSTRQGGKPAVHPTARVGDTIECDVQHPFQHTIRMKLETPAAAAYGNHLLMDPKSGWRLAGTAGACPVCGQTQCECPPGAQEVVRTMMEQRAMTKDEAMLWLASVRDDFRRMADEANRALARVAASPEVMTKCGSECDYVCQQPDGFGGCGKRTAGVQGLANDQQEKP
jgi:hypothetical protein